MLASADQANTINPGNSAVGATLTATPYFAGGAVNPLSPQAISPVGGSQPHTNFQPYLCVNFIISLFGIFPSPT
jgi:microcystin-dependent protein